MYTEKTSILYTGATGYVGGHALQRILTHPKANTFDITALVRDADRAKLLESKFGVKAVVGSLKDADKLTDLAEGAHLVFHAADSDDEPAMKAILAGMKKRHEKIGDTPILIHLSGAGSLTDDARGEYASQTVTSDLDIAAIDAIPPTAFHHAVDLMAVAADTEGYARTYIVAPGIIYGLSHGPLFDAGVARRNLNQVAFFADAFLARGRAGVVGKGASIWADVHIDDTTELFYLLFDKALTDPAKLGHGREGYYFAENGEHSLYALCKAVGTALVEAGRAENAEPTELTAEERATIFGGDVMAFLNFTNARCRADRARRDIGWKPVHTTEELYRVAKLEVQTALRKQVGNMSA
ncbi:NAD(P)-binding protein [Lentinus tigrinus ALCF2SS1-7]|uniref:NAD(P)-binding protein n=1 Tax=Lentinus tigrinus ALCF2SS1-7 TaxID=1328758 RepID=UPI0011661141|nr:NAD(P)-binding protein [Lentinus tigrinus ALCF2SS1-7]